MLQHSLYSFSGTESATIPAPFDDANFGEDRFEDGVRLKEVAEMEKMLIEPAIIIPVTESLDKYLKADRLELTMKNWANRVEWGWDYAKIVE